MPGETKMDVEAAAPSSENGDEAPEKDPIESDLKAHITLCERSSTRSEVRFLGRVLRKVASVRRRVTSDLLARFVAEHLPSSVSADLLSALGEAGPEGVEGAQPCPEVEAYLRLLCIIYLLDHQEYEKAVGVSESLVERFQEPAFNSRNLDPLLAKAYFYYGRCHELQKENTLASIRPYAMPHSSACPWAVVPCCVVPLLTTSRTLLAAYRTACLRHDVETQAALLNLLLRNFLEFNLYDQAEKLVNKATFPDTSASSNQHARFLYYTGRIQAIKLDYTQSFDSLTQALRKAPQNSAAGFRITVSKLLCIVQLLLGEIPERAMFSLSDFSLPLKPYFELTQAVRVGDLAQFREVVSKRDAVFRDDRTLSLIQRLRRNVIKTGLRKINESYSRISLQDICEKLHLDNIEDAEFIVAKAIRDGVIDATIDHDQKHLISRENIDVYSTNEPQDIFHQRIKFCLNLHNEAVMAMRFPDTQLFDDQSERVERLKQEEELAQEIAEEEDDDDMDDMGL